MLEEGMLETIRGIQGRYVFDPKCPAYHMPHAKVIDPVKQAYNDGWNACMSYLKDAGKI